MLTLIKYLLINKDLLNLLQLKTDERVLNSTKHLHQINMQTSYHIKIYYNIMIPHINKSLSLG